MGCGCNKKANGLTTPPRAVRTTVYQVIKDGGVITEFNNLQEARRSAISEGGQVRVSSKTV